MCNVTRGLVNPTVKRKISMDEIIEYLENSGKHSQLLSKWRETGDNDIRFEVLFAYWCEKHDLSLNYEVNVNSDNEKTVDFNLVTNNNVTVNLELVRPDLNKGIRDQLSGDVLQGYILTSDHRDPNFSTCAQNIKLQWALLKKAEKFPPCSNTTINIIVADCSNVHGGMFDSDDLGVTMYGYPGNPAYQEFWDGNKLIGMWEEGYNQRGAEDFNNKISAVIFVPKQKIELLDKGLTALNPLHSTQHRQLILDELKIYQAFDNVQVVQ